MDTILEILASIAIPIITAFVAKAMHTIHKDKRLNRFMQLAKIVVTAVEEDIGAGNGSLKEQAAMEFLLSKGVSQQTAELLVSSTVHALRNSTDAAQQVSSPAVIGEAND